MQSQLKEKRGSTLKFIALGTLVALSSTLTGCSTAPTAIAQKDQDKDQGKEKNKDKDRDKDKGTSQSSGHYYGSHGVRAHVQMGSSGTPRPSGTVSRGWFGGFRFCGG